MTNIKGEIESEESIYFLDLYRLLSDTIEEVIDDSIGEQSCCHCASTKNDKKCDCVLKKVKMDGIPNHFIYAGHITLERACELVMEVNLKVTSALEEESFICECPPEKKEVENN